MTEFLIYQSNKRNSDRGGKTRSDAIAADNVKARAILERAGWTVVERFSDTPDEVTETTEVEAVDFWSRTETTIGQVKALTDAGFGTEDALNAATDAELQAVNGIGAATVRNLRKALKAEA